MATRLELITEARSWLRTPWVDHGRLKGVACDCVGHIIGSAKAVGLLPQDFDFIAYGAHPDPAVMRKVLTTFCTQVDSREKLGGDVLFMRPQRIDQHLALYTFDNSIIHAIDKQRGVREHRLDTFWERRICGVYRFPNIQ